MSPSWKATLVVMLGLALGGLVIICPFILAVFAGLAFLAALWFGIREEFRIGWNKNE